MTVKEREKPNILSRFEAKTENFFYGPFYAPIVILGVLAFYFANFPVPGLILISLTAGMLFLCYKDTTPVFPLLLSAVFLFRSYSSMENSLVYLSLVPAAAGLIAHPFIYPIKNYRPGSLIMPLIIVTVAYYFSGTFSIANDPIISLVYSTALGPVIIIVYLLFHAYSAPPERVNVKRYFCYSLVVAALGVALQMAMYTLSVSFFHDGVFPVAELGWGNINNAACFIALAIPACWYSAVKADNPAPFVAALALLYIGLLLTRSDGMIGITFVFSPLLIYYACTRTPLKNRYDLYGSFVVTIYALLCALLIVSDIKGLEQIKDFFGVSFGDSGRTKLYYEALDLFRTYPFFGVGVGYKSYSSSLSFGTLRAYNFHGTFFHVLGTMGIFGIFAYAIYIGARYKILVAKNTDFHLFMFIAFTMFECYGFIDTCEFNVLPLMVATTLLLVVVELSDKRERKETLPLSICKNFTKINR